jgi:hypothetical protein
VLNPGVIYDEEKKKFIMLYRAAGDDVRHQIVFGLAESDDGIHFTRMSDQPAMKADPDYPDGGSLEDPRMVKLDGRYFITYAAEATPPGRYWIVDEMKRFRREIQKLSLELPEGVAHAVQDLLVCGIHTAGIIHVRKHPPILPLGALVKEGAVRSAVKVHHLAAEIPLPCLQKLLLDMRGNGVGVFRHVAWVLEHPMVQPLDGVLLTKPLRGAGAQKVGIVDIPRLCYTVVLYRALEAEFPYQRAKNRQ